MITSSRTRIAGRLPEVAQSIYTLASERPSSSASGSLAVERIGVGAAKGPHCLEHGGSKLVRHARMLAHKVVKGQPPAAASSLARRRTRRQRWRRTRMRSRRPQQQRLRRWLRRRRWQRLLLLLKRREAAEQEAAVRRPGGGDGGDSGGGGGCREGGGRGGCERRADPGSEGGNRFLMRHHLDD